MRDYREILINELEKRQLSNSQYSLRAFARDLSLSPSRLSEILRGKQGLSRDRAKDVAESIGFDEKGQAYFGDLVEVQHARSALEKEHAKKRIEDADNLAAIRVIKEELSLITKWYDLAIRRLTEVEGFQSDVGWISHRLGITVQETENALDRLKKSGTIEIVDGQIIASEDISTGPNKTHEEHQREVRELYKGFFEKALEARFSQPLEQRDHSAHLFGINYSQIPKIKQLLRHLEDELDSITYENDTKDAVYCLSTQLFCIEKNPPPFKRE